MMSAVVSISLGLNHAACALANGQVFSWGVNTYGQLCTAPPCVARTNATRGITSSTGVSTAAARTAAAAASTAASALGGSGGGGGGVRGVGVGIGGVSGISSAGTGRVTSSATPVPASCLLIEHIVAVVCGSNHTLALNKQGVVFAWGKASEGQLGVAIGIGERFLDSAVKVVIPTSSFSSSSTSSTSSSSSSSSSSLSPSTSSNVVADTVTFIHAAGDSSYAGLKHGNYACIITVFPCFHIFLRAHMHFIEVISSFIRFITTY